MSRLQSHSGLRGTENVWKNCKGGKQNFLKIRGVSNFDQNISKSMINIDTTTMLKQSGP